MIPVNLNFLLNELMTFNTSDLTQDELRGFLTPLIEEIVEAVNRDPNEGYIWDVISRYEMLMKGNANLESLANGIYNDILKYRQRNRFDSRLKMKVDDQFAEKGRFSIYIVMDLDKTLDEQLRAINTPETIDIDEMVSENPTAEELSLLEKNTH